MIIWITGQPGAGKTTLGRALATRLKCCAVDGKAIWHMYGLANVNFCNRAQNVQHAQNLAKMFHSSGQDCVVSMVSPYRNQREEFKREMGQNLLEVYVQAEQDPTRPRQEDRFDGYEPPLENYLLLDTSAKPVDQCVAEVMRLIGRP